MYSCTAATREIVFVICLSTKYNHNRIHSALPFPISPAGFVFDIALTGAQDAASDLNNRLFSVSDDRFLKVWNLDASKELQSLIHSNTVWACAVFGEQGMRETGGTAGGKGQDHRNDVVTVCADNTVRVWSSDPSRQAEAEVQEAQISEAQKACAEASAGGRGHDSAARGEGRGGTAYATGQEERRGEDVPSSDGGHQRVQLERGE